MTLNKYYSITLSRDMRSSQVALVRPRLNPWIGKIPWRRK